MDDSIDTILGQGRFSSLDLEDTVHFSIMERSLDPWWGTRQQPPLQLCWSAYPWVDQFRHSLWMVEWLLLIAVTSKNLRCSGRWTPGQDNDLIIPAHALPRVIRIQSGLAVITGCLNRGLNPHSLGFLNIVSFNYHHSFDTGPHWTCVPIPVYKVIPHLYHQRVGGNAICGQYRYNSS